MVSYRSNNTTGSSLIVLHWQRSFLAVSACYKMLTQHYTRDTAGHYAIACNVHSCGYSDIVLGSLSLIACKHLALIQYCSVLARRGFCTIVLHYTGNGSRIMYKLYIALSTQRAHHVYVLEPLYNDLGLKFLH